MATVSAAARPLEASRVEVARGSARRVPRVGLYLLVLLIAVWSLFPIVYMVNLSLMETVDVLGKPPTPLAIPPKPQYWVMVLLGNTALYKQYGGFEAGV